MNAAGWFMVAQLVLNVCGAIGFYYAGKWQLAGIWACYSGAQVFWTFAAIR
jgi:hypothetical protein